MRAIVWPNKLGWDVGSAEVMRLPNGLRVHTSTRCAIVKTTDDPVEAVKLTRKFGHLRDELDGMNHSDAQGIFRTETL